MSKTVDLKKKQIKKRKTSIKSDTSVASTIFKTVCLILLIAYSISIVFTIAFSILTSVKDPDVYKFDILCLPFGNKLRIENYLEVLKIFQKEVTLPNGDNYMANIITMLKNSLYFAVGGAFFSTLFCCIMAYAVARFDNIVSKIIYGIVIVCMALPIVGSLPSELHVLNILHLYDTRIGLIFLASSFLGMHFLVFHAAFKGIPKEFSEAAKIDGASELKILVRIILPLVRLVFSTIFLLKFIVLWNNYETPLIHTPDYPVLAYGVFSVCHDEKGGKYATMPHHLASGMIVLIPILILFMFTHKKLIGNVSMGGVKG